MPDPTPPATRLTAVPDEPVTRSDYLPVETAPPPPDLLAALDAGDEEAVWAWLRAHTPEPGSLVVYGALALAGVIGLVEWPAVVLSALGTLVIDLRFAGVENLAAEMRAQTEGTPRPV